jgi:hypothetical protein
MLEAARDFATVLPRAARWRKAASEKSLAQRTQLYTSGDELAGGDHRGMTDDGDVFSSRSTQKPLSSLWNVTRSTRPAKTSVVGLLIAAIDCLTRSSPEHLRLSI